jgi:hypothetical protein
LFPCTSWNIHPIGRSFRQALQILTRSESWIPEPPLYTHTGRNVEWSFMWPRVPVGTEMKFVCQRINLYHHYKVKGATLLEWLFTKTYGGVRVELHGFLTLTLSGFAPQAFYFSRDRRYPLIRRLGCAKPIWWMSIQNFIKIRLGVLVLTLAHRHAFILCTLCKEHIIIFICSSPEARGSVVGWGTMPQAGSPLVRFPMRSLRIFNWPNPSSRTMALGPTQPLTEMSTRNLPRGKGRPARGADNLTAIFEPAF